VYYQTFHTVIYLLFYCFAVLKVNIYISVGRVSKYRALIVISRIIIQYKRKQKTKRRSLYDNNPNFYYFNHCNNIIYIRYSSTSIILQCYYRISLCVCIYYTFGVRMVYGHVIIYRTTTAFEAKLYVYKLHNNIIISQVRVYK